MLTSDTAPKPFRDQSWGTMTKVVHAWKHLLHAGICQETANGIHVEDLAGFVVVHTLQPIFLHLSRLHEGPCMPAAAFWVILLNGHSMQYLCSTIYDVQLLVQCANLVVSTRLYSLFLSADRVVRAARNFGVVVWLGLRVSHARP